MTRRSCWLAAALVFVAGTAPAADSPLFKTTASGTPKIVSIDAIRFAPHGVLLIGDGRGAQVIAVQTGDTIAGPVQKEAIDKIDEKLAGKLGTTAKGIKITDLAVNPASGKAYVAVLKQEGKVPVVLTVDGDGKIGEFSLEKVTYARIALPGGEKSPITKITDLAFAGDRILVAGQASEEFACKMLTIPVPLEHDAKGTIYSTETFHVSHNAWETRAPMSSILPFEDGGKRYLIGSFACTPVVKYPLDELQPNAKVKGISVIELGSGNRPLRMFTYEKDGKNYVLMNTFRFHHKQKPFGPSPYWTVRFERDLLAENDKVNQKAVRRIDGKYEPVTDRIKQIEDFNGVELMDKLGKDKALTLREDGKGGYRLAPVALP
jgi:hypothetical protein